MVPARELVPVLPWVKVVAPLMTPVEVWLKTLEPTVEIAPPPSSEPVRLRVPAVMLVVPL